MAHVPLLINIGLALGYALLGGLAARKLGLPTIVGYLLAGVALGPFTPGFTGDIASIQQLAELGVILLMFGIGLHFSLSDLWRVRDIAIPGALIQMGVATAVGYWMAVRWWGWSPSAALVLGVSISVASTVVLLRGLMDVGALDAAALAIVATARQVAADLHVITRASTWEGARHLRDVGATAIVRPELEGGIEMVRRTLLALRFPAYDVQRYTDAVRSEEAGVKAAADDRAKILEDLSHAVGHLDIAWLAVSNQSPVAGRTLAGSNVRARTSDSRRNFRSR